MKTHTFNYTSKQGIASTREIFLLEESEASLLGLDIDKLSEAERRVLESLEPLFTEPSEQSAQQLKQFSHAIRRFLRPSIQNLRETEPAAPAPAEETG